MHDDEAAPLLASLSEDEQFATWRLGRRDGSLVGSGAGGVELLRAMRLSRPVGRVLALVPARLLDALYRPIARYRGVLGRLVPDGSAPKRFP